MEELNILLDMIYCNKLPERNKAVSEKLYEMACFYELPLMMKVLRKENNIPDVEIPESLVSASTSNDISTINNSEHETDVDVVESVSSSSSVLYQLASMVE